VGAARLGPILDGDVVDLEREALLAAAGRVCAGDEARWADRLPLDEVLGGGVGLAFPDDQVDEQRAGLAVAPVAADGDGRDTLAYRERRLRGRVCRRAPEAFSGWANSGV
jgi:hypothetical protein